ncbi:MAG: heat-inducible transcriptional repressor HrcA [Chlamydiales bacterium]
MIKKSSKKESRAFSVLIGLIELYLKTGKSIGSNTLKESGFQGLSSATIRNYFVEMEKQGLLHQPHSSGGRIPTNEAFRLYAQEALFSLDSASELEKEYEEPEVSESRDLTRFLQKNAEKLSELTGYAVFFSSVRFDYDFIQDIKLVNVNNDRLLCVMITDFGQILTEILPLNKKLSLFSIKKIESQIQWRIKGGKKPNDLTEEEKIIAQNYSNEIMVRYLVRYSNFSDEDIFRTGFSTLLSYPEFNDPIALATGLSLFENPSHMRLLLSDCVRTGCLRYWIGSDLTPYAAAAEGCSVIAIPYRVGETIAGAIGILGPCRMPYRKLFGTMQLFSKNLSNSLKKSFLKFKISLRHPRSIAPYIKQTAQHLLEIKE